MRSIDGGGATPTRSTRPRAQAIYRSPANPRHMHGICRWGGQCPRDQSTPVQAIYRTTRSKPAKNFAQISRESSLSL